MLVERANPRGGRPLTGYPIGEDPDTGLLGYKLGYCSCSCQKPIYIRTIELREVVDNFGVSDDYYRKQILPRKPIKHKIIEWLGGRVD